MKPVPETAEITYKYSSNPFTNPLSISPSEATLYTHLLIVLGLPQYD
jgi:hypothetical protein